MAKTWLVSAIFLIGVSGCASTDRFKSGSGDVGEVIRDRAVAFGAKPVSTNAVSQIGTQWRFFEDENGIVIRMAPSEYPALESFLIQTFGKPLKGPDDTPDGGRYGIYRFTKKGGTLQFGRDSVDGTHVEMIKPLTKQESAEAIANTLRDKEFQKALSASPPP